MTRLSKITSLLFRFLVVWTVDTLSLLVAAILLPSVVITPDSAVSTVAAAASAALMLGLVNFAIRPIVLLVARPFGFIVMFVVGFFVNALALIITSAVLPEFAVSGLLGAIVAGVVIAALNTFLVGIFSVDDSDSFYETRITRAAQKHPFQGATDPGRGLVMLEVDGLSYWHIRSALAQGAMPTVQHMIDKEGYVLSRVDCGLPSQTSACQAGIMFGDNYDIPSFRWYDKEKKKLYVSGHDAAELNARYADGNGLLRRGSSINNMMAGDAEKSSLTLANIFTGTAEEKKRRAEDIYLLMLDPYFLMRTIARFVGEAMLDVWQFFKQKQANVQPRLNRLHKGYPFVRAATTVLMRDLASSLVKLDIIRGSPSIYSTFVGYDEVAHHSGPWTTDAFGVLKRIDRVVAQTRDVIERKAPRPYELLLLSDHGQSFGATFKQRYGLDLKGFIESQLPQGATVAQSLGGDDGGPGLGAIGAELQNAQEQGVGGATGQFVVKQTQKLTQRGSRAEEDAGDAQRAREADVTVCGSGNIAQVYFDLHPRRVTLRELNLAYPGMVDALVGHEGVGFVVGYDDDCVPVVLGKGGSRNLHTGVVTGADPLKPFADGSAPPGGEAAEGLGPVGRGSLEDRIWQVRRVADFPHAGDLIVNSPVYPDGTVAAMEELIGSHGGIGGEQTDAFLLHPGDLVLPPTRNSVDMYHILDARRRLPPDRGAKAVQPPDVEPWALSTWGKGLADVSTWLGYAMRSIFLDRSAYHAVVNDPYSTAPALLIGIASQALASITRNGSFDLTRAVATVFAWFAAAVTVWFAGRLLGGKGTFTATLRGYGFAHSAYALALVSLLPGLGPLSALLALVLSVLGIWIAAAEAHKTRGWRTLVFPVVAVVVAVVGLAFAQQLLAGAALTWQSIAQALGLAQ
jgi:uncharacterized membrane protein YvlD (DUF360 family)